MILCHKPLIIIRKSYVICENFHFGFQTDKNFNYYFQFQKREYSTCTFFVFWKFYLSISKKIKGV